MSKIADRLSHAIMGFRRDKKEGGSYLDTFLRKLAFSTYHHWYEWFSVKKYLKGKVLNVGSGRDSGKIGISLDRCYGYEPEQRIQVKPDVVADINKLPFADNSFDSVVAFHILEHCEEPLKTIKELKRVTKKYICGMLPDVSGILITYYTRTPTHIQFWTRYDFKKVIYETGMTLVQYCKMKRILNSWSFDFVLQKTWGRGV